MTDKQAIKELRKMYFKNLDSIYKASEKTAKAWGVDHVPLKTLKAIIEVVKKGIDEGINEGS